ncbi:hypothetical protein CR513_40800, partial [Mucuna pruriens]
MGQGYVRLERKDPPRHIIKRQDEMKRKDLKLINNFKTILETILKNDTPKQIWEFVTRYFSKIILMANKIVGTKVTHEERHGESGREHEKTTYRVGRDDQSYNKTIDKQANFVGFDETKEILLMSYVEMHDSNKSDVWFLDSSCNNHMCGKCEIVFDSFNHIDVRFVNQNGIKKGSVSSSNTTRLSSSLALLIHSSQLRRSQYLVA